MFVLQRRELLRAGGLALSGLALGSCAGPRVEWVREPPPERKVAGERLGPRPPATDPRHLATPDLSGERILRLVAGLRPFRRGGPRVEAERIGERLLIHDYGHGGAGITLALGCAEEVRELVDEHVGEPIEVAVIGGGIAGLSVARALLRGGYGVRILAERFPPETTSDVAGGQFAPSLVGRPQGEGRLERWLRRAHAELKLVEGVEWGVSEVDNYTTARGGHGLSEIPRDLLPRVEELERLPFDGPPRRGWVYRTLLIEPPRFLPRLVAELHGMGAVFERRRFRSREEVLELDARCCVLCTGLGSRELAQDSAVVALRGQLVHLEPQDLGYLLSHQGYLFPRRDALVLGGTVERNVEDVTPDPQRCRGILEQHRAFFSSSDS